MRWRWRLGLLSLNAARGQLFDLTNGQGAAGGAMRVTQAQLLLGYSQQRTAVSRAELPFFDPVLNWLLQLEQANCVGHCCAVLASALSNLLLGHVKLIHQALESAGCFHGVQVFALDVFDERHLERELVGDLLHDGCYFGEAGSLGGTPAALPGYQLKLGADRPDNQRLNDAARLDGTCELVEALLVEFCARLVRTRLNQVNVNFLRTALHGLARRHGRRSAASRWRLRLRRCGSRVGLLAFKLPNKRSESPSQCVSRH